MNDLSPRQRAIVNLVNRKGDVSVDEIRQAVDISQATAYREIQELVKMGLVKKVHGGVSRVERSLTRCLLCGRENNPRTTVLMEQEDGVQFAACCPHCGLLTLARRTNIRVAMTPDFIYGTLLNASQAWYVLNSGVSLCCQPSLLSFSNSEDARRFAQGFGGEVIEYLEARRKVQELMAL